MVLLPYPTIDMVKTKVTLVFNSPFMKDRTFTVSAATKERGTSPRAPLYHFDP